MKVQFGAKMHQKIPHRKIILTAAMHLVTYFPENSTIVQNSSLENDGNKVMTAVTTRYMYSISARQSKVLPLR